MPGEVTQQNIHLFIPGKVAGAALLLARDRGLSPEEALVAFYGTKTYGRLEREETKYWHYSPAQLYQVLVETGEQAAAREGRTGESVRK